MMRHLVICVSLFFVLNKISGTQYVDIDQTTLIPIKVSSLNHNRIQVMGDRVKKAYFKGSNISVEVDDCSGQLFVQAVQPNCPNTTLSIVSASGFIQDLELQFDQCSSEIILLKPILDEEMETSASDTNPFKAIDSDLTSIVEDIFKGNIPGSYVSFDDQDTPVKIKNGLKMQRISRLVNDKQIVFVYRVHNDFGKVKQVTECQVNILDGDWVFLDRYKLKPNECGLVLIGCFR